MESSVRAMLEPLLEATGASWVPSDESGEDDLHLELDGRRIGAIRLPYLHDALTRLIAGVERDLGCSLGELDRTQKQEAVAMLHARGAFTLRKSVEDIADALGVSRFTVYNYLERVQ